MRYPATMATNATILEAVHGHFIDAVKPGGDLHFTDEQYRIIAGALLAVNIKMRGLMGKYEDQVQALAKYLAHPKAFKAIIPGLSVELVRPVDQFKTSSNSSVSTLAIAAQHGILGILSALLGEELRFVSPDDDEPAMKKFVNWDVADRTSMTWCVPHLVKRKMHLNTDSRGAELPSSFESDGSSIDNDPKLTNDVEYIAYMLYRRAVRRLFTSLSMCSSIGYATSMLCGAQSYSSYYEADDKDEFLPSDMIEKMNTVLHYDPPTGYILQDKDGKQYASYHASASDLPSLAQIAAADPLTTAELPASTKDQFSAFYGPDTVSADKLWVVVSRPKEIKAVRDASKIAVDFAIQRLFEVTGALTPGTRGSRRWYRNYIDLDQSYASLFTTHLGVKSVVVENGVFMAYLTRFVITKDSGETGPVVASFTLFADRGFLKDFTDQLGTTILSVDDKKYEITFQFTSEWTPSGPGMRVGDPNIGDSPDTEDDALTGEMGTESRFSPYSAYLALIKEVEE